VPTSASSIDKSQPPKFSPNTNLFTTVDVFITDYTCYSGIQRNVLRVSPKQKRNYKPVCLLRYAVFSRGIGAYIPTPKAGVIAVFTVHGHSDGY
jgi:hypothetical protein